MRRLFMADVKKLHVKIKMEVFGEEYWNNETTYSGTPQELVVKIQEGIAQAMLALNKK